MPTDPVCKIVVCRENDEITSQFYGKKFFFCSESCRSIFEEEPAKYTLEQAESIGGFKSWGL